MEASRSFIEEVRSLPRGREVAEELPCTKVDPQYIDAIFHPNAASEHTVDAQRICGSCPIQTMCMTWAWSNNESGVWGGQLFRNGKPLATTPRKRGRKRKDTQVA